MTTGDPESKRRKPRFSRHPPIRFGTEARMISGTVMNVSGGGLQLQSDETFPINSVVTIFVQFHRQTFRLRARVEWTGESGRSTGLSFVDPAPHLAETYRAWLFEVKDTTRAGQERVGDVSSGAATPAHDGTCGPVTAPAEPQSPVRRSVQTMGGQVYDILIERRGGSWSVTVFQMPRMLGVQSPDLQRSFPDFASADRAVREFIRSRP